MNKQLQQTSYKKTKIVPCVICLIYLFFLLCPQILIAGTITRKNDSARAQEILADAPKTPEELLVRLKSLLQNQNNNGLVFAEKLTGIEIKKWKTDPYNKNDFYRPYSFNLWRDWLWKDIDVDKWPPFDSRPTINFLPLLSVDDYRDNKFFNFNMRFNASKKNDDFSCITPATTKEIIGTPLMILSYIDDKTESSHSSQLIYKYKINNFKVRIEYEVNADTPSSIKYDSNLLEDFNNHKDLCSSKITVSKSNPLKLQHSGAAPEWVKEISAKIPKNANEFLQRLKSSWTNQKSNVIAFAEKVTGVNLCRWMKIQNNELLRYYIFLPAEDLEDYPDFAYSFHMNISPKNSFFRVHMRYVKNSDDNLKFNMHPIICVTPEETKEILGEPSVISGIDQRTTEGAFSKTRYLYEIDNTTIEFIYPNPGGISQKYMDFNIHKQFCASRIEFTQKANVYMASSCQ